jgi:hypothetical protein
MDGTESVLSELRTIAPRVGSILSNLTTSWQKLDGREQDAQWNEALVYCLESGFVELELKWKAERTDAERPDQVTFVSLVRGRW